MGWQFHKKDDKWNIHSSISGEYILDKFCSEEELMQAYAILKLREAKDDIVKFCMTFPENTSYEQGHRRTGKKTREYWRWVKEDCNFYNSELLEKKFKEFMENVFKDNPEGLNDLMIWR